MQCISPYIKYDKDLANRKEVNASRGFRCGRCAPCRKHRSSGWIFRLLQEQKVSKTAAFLTLTYDDELLSYTQDGEATLDYEDHRKFFKRLRRNIEREYGYNPRLKYYGCGEYGGDTQRPHFHYIVFNIPEEYLIPIWDNEKKITWYPHIYKAWKNGHVDVGSANSNSMAYVTGYLSKSIHSSPDDKLQDGRHPEKPLMSKGLGKSFLTEQMISYLQAHPQHHVESYGKQAYPMSRYYKEKLYAHDERYQVQLRNAAKELMDTWQEKYYHIKEDDLNAWVARKDAKLKSIYNHKAKYKNHG